MDNRSTISRYNLELIAEQAEKPLYVNGRKVPNSVRPVFNYHFSVRSTESIKEERCIGFKYLPTQAIRLGAAISQILGPTLARDLINDAQYNTDLSSEHIVYFPGWTAAD